MATNDNVLSGDDLALMGALLRLDPVLLGFSDGTGSPDSLNNTATENFVRELCINTSDETIYAVAAEITNCCCPGGVDGDGRRDACRGEYLLSLHDGRRRQRQSSSLDIRGEQSRQHPIRPEDED